MKNTEYTLGALLGTVTTPSSLDSLLGLIDDMGLELVAVCRD